VVIELRKILLGTVQLSLKVRCCTMHKEIGGRLKQSVVFCLTAMVNKLLYIGT